MPRPSVHETSTISAWRRNESDVRPLDIAAYCGDTVGLAPVDLVQRDDSLPQPEELQDLQVFHRLRHDAVVCGDHKEGVLVAGDAGHHVVNEAAVARHVDEADARAADVGVCKPQVDG